MSRMKEIYCQVVEMLEEGHTDYVIAKQLKIPYEWVEVAREEALWRDAVGEDRIKELRAARTKDGKVARFEADKFEF